MRALVGVYLLALAAALIAWMSGSLYGNVPPLMWLVCLVLQCAIGGGMVVAWWKSEVS